MTSWKTYRLGDVCSRLRSGKGIPASEVSTCGKFAVVGGNGVRGYTDTSNFNGQCVVVGRQGAYCGNVRYFDGEFYMTEHAVVIVGNELADTHFLAYLLSTMHLGQLSAQSAQPGLSVQTLSKLEISLPSLEEQRRIAGILGTIDDKIENNRRINTNLELQAQALYKQWFVDSSIVKLGDVVKTTSGGTPSRSHMEFYVGKYGWVKSKELNSSFITKTEETITDDAIAKSAAKLLPAKSILIAMYGATVGQYAILSQPMTCNQAVCALLPNENYPYTYLFMVAKNIKEELANKAIGSAQQNISQVIIKDIDISSDIEKIKQFHTIVCPHFEVMEKNQKENETLAILRDTLLPKLMNGEIKV